MIKYVFEGTEIIFDFPHFATSNKILVVVALILALKSCFIHDPRRLVRYWKQKACPTFRPPATAHECANYNSICPYGFRYHQSQWSSTRHALPIVAAFCFVITSILPLIFLFLRRHIQFLPDIISIDIFCWDIIDIVRSAERVKGETL